MIALNSGEVILLDRFLTTMEHNKYELYAYLGVYLLPICVLLDYWQLKQMLVLFDSQIKSFMPL